MDTTQKKCLLGGGDTAQHRKMGGGHCTYFVEGGTIGVWTPHNIERKSLAVGGPSQEIIPLRGSILQAETCQILSFAENPRWSPSVAIRMNPFREQLPLSRVSVFQSEEEVDLFSGLCC